MRFSINIPNFGDFADAEVVAKVASAAESSGLDGGPARPFEIVLGGPSPTSAAAARDLLDPFIEAGATWWDERRPMDDEVDRLEPVLRRIEAGPPAL